MSLDLLFTKKQQEVLKALMSEDWFIAVLHGAVRSGKTYLNNYIFLYEVRRVAEIAKREGITNPMYILAGYTKSNIQDNVLNELSNVFGFEFKFDKFGSFELFGVKIVQTTHGTKNGVGRIRGMTAFGAYVNETSLANESVFEEIKARCSGKGARIIADTNPSHPEHWLKKNYIDSDSPSIRSFNFVLEDNTFLSQRYIDNLKASTPTGMFYDRTIKGLWVSGEGVVYPDFDITKHLIPAIDENGNHFPYWNCDEYIVGCDWGYSHYGSILVLGRIGNNWYLVEEYAEQYKEIDYWVNIALNITNRYGYIPFYCDSARPEHVDRFLREGINAINADKSIMSGIEHVAKLIKSDNFYIVKHDKDLHILKELYAYAWNDSTGLPIKENDDCLDALRYALYTHCYNPIEISNQSIFK